MNVTLEDDYAEKLALLAERMHVQPGTVARSLLCRALDEADPDVQTLVELLDAIPGAHERAQAGLKDARAGRTVPIDAL